MKKVIHVNRHQDTPLPVFTIKTYNNNHQGMEVTINGPSKLVYHPEKPLSCGAEAWIETTSEVVVDGKTIL